jgi:myo-inositol-1(or 4)-monophosphatase
MLESVFATGIPFAKVAPGRRLPFARVMGALMPQVAGIRRFGAAALDLAWVAAGRYEGYWEFGIKPWDCAAGALLVREAGGYCTDPSGKDIDDLPDDVLIVAGNGQMHGKLRDIVAESLVGN